MIFRWDTEHERLVRGGKISPENKLEGLRLMNELRDKALPKNKKKILRKLRDAR